MFTAEATSADSIFLDRRFFRVFAAGFTISPYGSGLPPGRAEHKSFSSNIVIKEAARCFLCYRSRAQQAAWCFLQVTSASKSFVVSFDTGRKRNRLLFPKLQVTSGAKKGCDILKNKFFNFPTSRTNLRYHLKGPATRTQAISSVYTSSANVS